MESWKMRTLMLLTTTAMVLAISIPVSAQAPSCAPWDKDCDTQDESAPWNDSCAPWDKDCDPQDESDSQSDDCPPWDENCDSQSDNCPPWDENCDPQSDSRDDHSDDGLVDTYWVGGAQCFVTYDREDGGIDETVCFNKAGDVVWEG